jgi:hypothetical protein
MASRNNSVERTRSVEEPGTISLKIVLLGDMGVGKTKLAKRFTKDVYTQASKSTEGNMIEEALCRLQPTRCFRAYIRCLPNPHLYTQNAHMRDRTGICNQGVPNVRV